ncbi:unnamed protein product [Euphydryas editha]|uniref:Peptidase S1 domain-containing protein n=1 Tax=Euphydryas editha TaxID=104508 RepID=A0AAU9TLP9_EUPED|nr:unnamed protein product [Euphydryas editha]
MNKKVREHLETVTTFPHTLKHHSTRKCERHELDVPYSFMYQNKTVSQRKCYEYMYKLHERQQESDCKRKVHIIRGQKTQRTEYPHMGALGWLSVDNSWEFLCGSSLISERFVLTAAHCTEINNSARRLKSSQPQIVRLGVVNIYDRGHRDFNIKSIIRHPKYKSPIKYYDIALIKLETSVTFNRYISPACLWSENYGDMENQNFTITGWGSTENKTFSPNLLYATVDNFGSNCNNIPINRHWNGSSDHQLCAGKLDGSVDTCHGDSGGPIQFKLFHTKKEGTLNMIIGITSFGAQSCAQNNTPGVYTKVSSFIPWIEKNVWPDEDNMYSSQIVFPKD